VVHEGPAGEDRSLLLVEQEPERRTVSMPSFGVDAADGAKVVDDREILGICANEPEAVRYLHARAILVQLTLVPDVRLLTPKPVADLRDQEADCAGRSVAPYSTLEPPSGVLERLEYRSAVANP
jgi:hypothetical protein